MQLRNVGELKLLKAIRERFNFPPPAEGSGVIVGIGDDAAVIVPRKERLLVTTDMMAEGVHFDLEFNGPFPLGFKLVSSNVSDIMAMGGRPEYLFLDIAMKASEGEDFFQGLYDGISSAMDLYGVKLLGGDLSSARHDMVLAATVIGYGERVVTRGGASPGDRIYVTSTPGDSACGLEVLRRLAPESKKKITSNEFLLTSKDAKDKNLSLDREVILDWKTAGPLIMRHLMPVARDPERIAPHATSMIDVSDGLFIDLSRICDESGTGARVHLDRIPVSDEMRSVAEILGLDPLRLAVSGGEDYELLFTAPPDVTINDESLSYKITCIGEITAADRVVVDREGRESVLKAEGYRHFGSSR